MGRTFSLRCGRRESALMIMERAEESLLNREHSPFQEEMVRIYVPCTFQRNVAHVGLPWTRTSLGVKDNLLAFPKEIMLKGAGASEICSACTE